MADQKNIKRSYSVDITPKYGSTTITLKGEPAQQFWQEFESYKAGQTLTEGFNVRKFDDDTGELIEEVIQLFDCVCSARRYDFTTEEVDPAECVQINCLADTRQP